MQIFHLRLSVPNLGSQSNIKIGPSEWTVGNSHTVSIAGYSWFDYWSSILTAQPLQIVILTVVLSAENIFILLSFFHSKSRLFRCEAILFAVRMLPGWTWYYGLWRPATGTYHRKCSNNHSLNDSFYSEYDDFNHIIYYPYSFYVTALNSRIAASTMICHMQLIDGV
jgi:hypothetical protein